MRIREIDALRGFAICGIMVVNTWQHAPRPREAEWLMDQVFQGRFYPIFSFLFGVSFALFLRAHDSRVLLLRRLFVLAAFGAVHWYFNPGEVLLPYALLGAVVLVPASFLAREWTLLLGVGVVLWSFVTGNPWVLIAGLFALGLAAVEYDVAWRNPAFFLGSAVAAVALAWLSASPLAVQVAAATAYAAGFLLLSPRFFEPLGRMALTNYLASSVVILLARPQTLSAILLVSAVTLVVQWAFSTWWLSRHRYGPLEWVWRCLTWGRFVPNGQTGSHDPRDDVPDPGGPRSEDEPRDRA